MVYCTKCGTENDEEATECKNCGAPMNPIYPTYRRRDWDHEFYWNKPHRRGNWAILFGLFLILIGASTLLEDMFWWASFDVLWPLFIIGIGVLIVTNSMRR